MNEYQTERGKEIADEFERLHINVTEKRKLLLLSGLRRMKTRKLLNTISGLLALFSAGTITTLLLNIIGNNGMQIIAAATALIAGFISLILAHSLNDIETSGMFAGASAFLSLREKIGSALLLSDMGEKKALSLLDTFKKEYAELDAKYSLYLPVGYAMKVLIVSGYYEGPPRRRAAMIKKRQREEALDLKNEDLL